MFQLGLIGYPLSHSLSPRLHNAALRAMEIPGEYALYPIPNLKKGNPELSSLFNKLRNGKMRGLNVTIPYKQAVMEYLDKLSPTAAAVEAVNTLFMKDGVLLGENTDVGGFLVDIERLAYPLFHGKLMQSPGKFQLPQPQSRKQAIVLGAGGSALSVSYALLKTGWQVTIAARDSVKAQALSWHLAAALSLNNSSIPTYAEIPGLISGTSMQATGLQGVEASLVVNATPVGMHPDFESTPWPERLPFPAGAFIYDLVYNPPETRLVREAHNLGHPAANGIGMLIEQAALSLEIWSGQNVPRQSMWQAVADFTVETTHVNDTTWGAR